MNQFRNAKKVVSDSSSLNAGHPADTGIATMKSFIVPIALAVTALISALPVPVFATDVTDIVEIDTLPTGRGYVKIWQPFIAKWTDKHYVTAYGLQLNSKGKSQLSMGTKTNSASRP